MLQSSHFQKKKTWKVTLFSCVLIKAAGFLRFQQLKEPFEVNLVIFTISWDLQDLSIGVGEQGSEPWYAGNEDERCGRLHLSICLHNF